MFEFIIFVIGLAVGSFLNVVIDRSPADESIVFGRSKCDFCKKPLRWYELIPVFSFLIQLGKCRRCHKHLSIQYPLVEVITAIAFVFSSMASTSLPSYTGAIGAICLMIFSACVIGIGMADIKYQLIPDILVIGILGAGILYLSPSPHLWGVHGISALANAGIFFLLWYITRGKGMGFGDVKLAFALGLFLGHPGTIVAMYTAFLTGAIYGVILMIAKHARMKSRIAFGPFMLLGAFIHVLWGERIVAWAMYYM